MDLVDKFKADLPTAGKIWKLKTGLLSIIMYNIQQTLVGCVKEMQVAGESDRLSKEMRELFYPWTT